jgi:hypothetical protein
MIIMRYACVTCIRECAISVLSHIWWPSENDGPDKPVLITTYDILHVQNCAVI